MKTKITGRVLSSKIEEVPIYGYYDSLSERKDYSLKISMEDDNGMLYFFKSTPVTMKVVSGGPISIVLYNLDLHKNTFLKEINPEKNVADCHKMNENKLVPTINEGDVITVNARMKPKKVSKRGTKYTVLTHVELC